MKVFEFLLICLILTIGLTCNTINITISKFIYTDYIKFGYYILIYVDNSETYPSIEYILEKQMCSCLQTPCKAFLYTIHLPTFLFNILGWNISSENFFCSTTKATIRICLKKWIYVGL